MKKILVVLMVLVVLSSCSREMVKVKFQDSSVATIPKDDQIVSKGDVVWIWTCDGNSAIETNKTFKNDTVIFHSYIYGKDTTYISARYRKAVVVQ